MAHLFGQTLREAPSDAETPSHKLLVRGGFVRRIAAGIYAWLPLGLRVLKRVEQIVREEMDGAGAVELLMPILQPGDLWQKSGRWETYGPNLYRLKDRSERDFCLGPTHEEMIATLAQMELPSYRDLPKIAYQIQWKYRDEPRARGGLLRGREFYMKDAYSFDATEDGLLASYRTMEAAYKRAFPRMGLDPVQIEADPGAIGGTVNHEFTQPCPSGEDTFVSCDSCEYAANTEVASGRPPQGYDFGEAALEKVHTPDMYTVARVAEFLGVEHRQVPKTLVFKTSDAIVCALVPGDRELNEYKFAKAIGSADVALLTEEDFVEHGIPKGYIGPVDQKIRLIADRTLEGARNVVGGANETGYHLRGITAGRDFTPDQWADLISVDAGDHCDRCGGKLQIERGIEVGHIFQLVGASYLEQLDARFTDEDGSKKRFLMGCYGLGVSRAVAAIVETHHDERGMAWPRAVAPYQVSVVVLAKDARDVTDALDAPDVLIDDRDVSAGVKFSDADLIGCPLQVVVGKTYTQAGKFEAKVRATGERFEIDPTPEAVRTALDRCR